MKTISILSCLSLFLLLSGCALTPKPDTSRFYTLPVPKTQAGEAALGMSEKVSLGVMPISLPDYLLRPFIVMRSEGGQVHWREDVRWAESLDAGMLRVLRSTLEQRIPTADIRSFPRTDRTDYRIYLEVFRCEVSKEGKVFIEAHLNVDSAKTGERVISSEVAIEDNWRTRDYAAFAEQISQAIAALVERLDWSKLPEHQ